MPKQPVFSVHRDAMKKRQTRRDLFLAKADAVVLRISLLALIEPYYPKAGPKKLGATVAATRRLKRSDRPSMSLKI